MSHAIRISRTHPLVEKAAPVIKWAGGKTRLLPQLLPLLPDAIDRYYEPFIGGGAIFFNLQPGDAIISDVNEELTNVYFQVQNHVEALITSLQQHRYEKTYYYTMRAKDPARLSPLERASRILYLNRTCFNGLYRVNRRGHFNVPFGRYTNPAICQPARLRAANQVLANTTILTGDYSDTCADAKQANFVYFDPPYHPISKTANFTSYTKGNFGEDDQARLASVYRELTDQGVKCMLSNSDTPLIRELYQDFNIHVVSAHRAIARRSESRKRVNEVVVCNYERVT
jgi:DNA adenine methylase